MGGHQVLERAARMDDLDRALEDDVHGHEPIALVEQQCARRQGELLSEARDPRDLRVVEHREHLGRPRAQSFAVRYLVRHRSPLGKEDTVDVAERLAGSHVRAAPTAPHGGSAPRRATVCARPEHRASGRAGDEAARVP